MSLPGSPPTQTTTNVEDREVSPQPMAASQSEMPRYARSTSTLDRQEIHRRSQMYARITYGLIIVLFVSVCAFAVTMSMQTERNRQGFRPITVKKPISFVDYTYVKKGGDAKSETPESPQQP